MRPLNKVAAGGSQPPFLQRIHDRDAAKKKEQESEERKRLAWLALDIALAVLKANQLQAEEATPGAIETCRRRSS